MRIASFILAIVALAMSAGAAHAKSPVQVTPDDSAILVNKPVGTEQWVLSLSLDDETLSGNVFDSSGAPPTFFFCDADTDDGFSEPEDLMGVTITFDNCVVAQGCTVLPCDPDIEWHDLGSIPTLPGSFFLP
jgi:hypothetical protein